MPSRLIAKVETGETVMLTRDGKPFARISPETVNDEVRPERRLDDSAFRAAHERLQRYSREWQGDGYRVGKFMEEDKYGDAELWR